jgi:hypothetical protein
MGIRPFLFPIPHSLFPVKEFPFFVKGTLAVIRKLSSEGKIGIESLDVLYQQLLEIDFRVKRSLFNQIFEDNRG